MQTPREIAVEINFEKRVDGRYYVHSLHVPGLHLAGPNLDALRSELETVIKDLLWHNSDIVIDTMRWVPSLDDVVSQLKGATGAREPIGNQTYILEVRDAA